MNPESSLINDVLIKAVLAIGYFSGEPVAGGTFGYTHHRLWQLHRVYMLWVASRSYLLI